MKAPIFLAGRSVTHSTGTSRTLRHTPIRARLTYGFLIYQFAPLLALLACQALDNPSSLLLARSDRS